MSKVSNTREWFAISEVSNGITITCMSDADLSVDEAYSGLNVFKVISADYHEHVVSELEDRLYHTVRRADEEKYLRDAIALKVAEYEKALEIYALTNETFPEYGAIAREALRKGREG